MGSLFTSFGVGVQGIHSSQSGLNTTSHNLANTKTPGYTRQQNINADMPYQTYKVTGKHTSQIGMGTRVDTIRQIRDQFLDKEYRLEFSRQSFYDKLVETESEIEDVFGEMEGVEFRYALNEIWAQIETLSTDPGSIVYRKLFIAGAEAFIDRANDVNTDTMPARTAVDTVSFQSTPPNAVAAPMPPMAACAVVFMARMPAAFNHFLFLSFNIVSLLKILNVWL